MNIGLIVAGVVIILLGIWVVWTTIKVVRLEKHVKNLENQVYQPNDPLLRD